MRQVGLGVYTYNILTLRTDDDTSRPVKEFGNLKWHVVGLCETQRSGKGLGKLSGGSWMYVAGGKTEENPNTKGLALIINKKFTDYVEKN